MLMLDEAAHVAPLRNLPTLAATGAGQGIQICSVWQDLAQIEQIYSRSARSLINNHTARVFLPGNGDLATLDELSRLLADHETHRTSHSTSRDGSGGSFNHSPTDERLAPLDYLRQLPMTPPSSCTGGCHRFGCVPRVLAAARHRVTRGEHPPRVSPPVADAGATPQKNGPSAGFPHPATEPVAAAASAGPTDGEPFTVQEATMPIPSTPPGPQLLEQLDLLTGRPDHAIDPRTGRRYTLATAIDGTSIPIPDEMTEAERADLDVLHDTYTQRLADATDDAATATVIHLDSRRPDSEKSDP